jgi:hypothetical protein
MTDETAATPDPASLTTAMKVAGMYRPVLIERLKRNGFTQAEAEQWTPPENPFWTRHDLLHTACAYRDAGFEVLRARDWARTQTPYFKAIEYENAGWSPDDLRDIRRAIRDVSQDASHDASRGTTRATAARPDVPASLRHYQADVDLWLDSGIPGHLVPLYIRTDHTTASAHDIDAQRRNGNTDIVPALTVLAALKHPASTTATRPNPASASPSTTPHDTVQDH